MKNFDLTGKTAIITGGGSGIGQGIARRFAAGGARTYLLDIQPATSETVREIEANGGMAVWKKCDVTDQPEVIRIINSIQEESPIDILIQQRRHRDGRQPRTHCRD